MIQIDHAFDAGTIMPWMVRYSIWDLDNCLFDDGWRTQYIDWHLEGNARYNRYDSRMHMDAPMHLAEFHTITALSTPIFLTGRREQWRWVTQELIHEHLTLWRDGCRVRQQTPLILMREQDCNDRPVDVKRRMLLSLPEKGIQLSQIIAAFDDVPAIVQMYLNHGIPAAILRKHDPALAYKPEDM
jgi:hypothetical protein